MQLYIDCAYDTVYKPIVKISGRRWSQVLVDGETGHHEAGEQQDRPLPQSREPAHLAEGQNEPGTGKVSGHHQKDQLEPSFQSS